MSSLQLSFLWCVTVLSMGTTENCIGWEDMVHGLQVGRKRWKEVPHISPTKHGRIQTPGTWAIAEYILNT